MKLDLGVYNDLAGIWLKLDSLQQSHFDNININFLTSLESKLFELQEVEKSKASYEKLVSVLEKLEKLKLKKVNSNTEEEIHTASVNVEDAKFTLERKMLGIERGKEQEQNNLEDFVNSEIGSFSIF